jgi:hypothetical protein
MIIFGAALVVLYLVFWAWHSPWAGKLSKAEIDRYLGIIEKRLLPAEEVKAFSDAAAADQFCGTGHRVGGQTGQAILRSSTRLGGLIPEAEKSVGYQPRRSAR